MLGYDKRKHNALFYAINRTVGVRLSLDHALDLDDHSLTTPICKFYMYFPFFDIWRTARFTTMVDGLFETRQQWLRTEASHSSLWRHPEGQPWKLREREIFLGEKLVYLNLLQNLRHVMGCRSRVESVEGYTPPTCKPERPRFKTWWGHGENLKIEGQFCKIWPHLVRVKRNILKSVSILWVRN